MYHNSIDRLINILNELRDKCPWDKKQTIHSLSTQTIEEMYELNDAILNEDWDNIKEELGDLLLHILFYSKIGTELGKFNFGDVIENVSNKLVKRHPHIYETLQVKDADEVKKNWEQIKLKEGKKSVLQGVPNSLPALVKAYRLQDKAKQIGFDWDNTNDVLAKVKEEINEVEMAINDGNEMEIKSEIGDVLFSLINFARHINVNPEEALQLTNQKFKKRFETMEDIAKNKNISLQNLNLKEMDELWEVAKKLNQ